MLPREKGTRKKWKLRCECGTVKVTNSTSAMKSGKSQSCGCFHQEAVTKHGLWRTPIYECWAQMIKRCYKPWCRAYGAYGAKGIKACEHLRISALNLLVVMGERPTADHSIDRIQNKLGYFCGSCAECVENNWPLNVKWSTQKEQMNNRNCTTFIEIDGVKKPLEEWADQSGVKSETIRGRLNRGWPSEKLLSPHWGDRKQNRIVSQHDTVIQP